MQRACGVEHFGISEGKGVGEGKGWGVKYSCCLW